VSPAKNDLEEKIQESIPYFRSIGLMRSVTTAKAPAVESFNIPDCATGKT
jgi:hypothetical protein